MSISVSIVEDLDEVREGLHSILSSHDGLKIVGKYKSAEEALEGIPAHIPDVVIMDINLPGMSGIQCIKQLKNITKHTQFMMFTVYENDDKVFDALKAGATGYLLKNTPTAVLIEALKELNEGGSPMSANIARKVVSHFQQDMQMSNTDMLSPREEEVLKLLSRGLLYKEIAFDLSLSTGTVRQHIHRIYEKLHVQNRTEALNKAYGHK